MIFPELHRGQRRSTLVSALGLAPFVLGIVASAGCAKKGARSNADASDGAADASDGSDGSDGATKQYCPTAGTWQLTHISCGTMEISPTWFMVVPNTTIKVTAKANGGCDIVTTSQSHDCRQVTADEIIPPTGMASWQQTSKGITECFPEACRFQAAVPDDAGADADPVDAGAGGAGGNSGAGGAGGASADAGRDAATTTIDQPCMVGSGKGTRPPDTVIMNGDMFTSTAPTAMGVCRTYGLAPQIAIWQRVE